MSGYYQILDLYVDLNVDISKRGEVISKVIGYKGCNINRIRRICGGYTYIRFYSSEYGLYGNCDGSECDKVYIYSNLEEGLKNGIKLLKEYIINVLNNNSIFKYKRLLKLENKEIIGSVIGKNGRELKSIMNEVPGTYIIYDNRAQSFIIYANTYPNIKNILKIILHFYKQCEKIYIKNKKKYIKSNLLKKFYNQIDTSNQNYY